MTVHCKKGSRRSYGAKADHTQFLWIHWATLYPFCLSVLFIDQTLRFCVSVCFVSIIHFGCTHFGEEKWKERKKETTFYWERRIFYLLFLRNDFAQWTFSSIDQTSDTETALRQSTAAGQTIYDGLPASSRFKMDAVERENDCSLGRNALSPYFSC